MRSPWEDYSKRRKRGREETLRDLAYFRERDIEGERRNTDPSQTIVAKTQNENQQESNRVKGIKEKDFSTGDRIIIQKN